MSWTHARSRVAGLHARPEDDPEKVDARAELKFELLADRIERDLAGAPLLTCDQRERLAVLLNCGPQDYRATRGSGGDAR
jgi:hypothetical protein